ncbi:hypothetical protein KFL_003530090 [Klebsormidium nitens]|uniref:DM2 domain-containing protein n=1 Tax=Klebsormidium nitens TaxID=105231 RepID=A0A1Y1I8Z0_KLENI|nr:hypothetical protein KFL_003530090 [Klebsormidium nitens]|eukprot:GAQ87445.1 hypothetical protein KFL_003530090 [Klebsormidium nitens]
MFTFEPRLVILIAPKAAEVDNPRYELLWKDTELLKGQAFYLPGSIDDGGDVVPQHNNDPPPLYLYGRKDYSDKHHAITIEHKLLRIASGHLPPITL